MFRFVSDALIPLLGATQRTSLSAQPLSQCSTFGLFLLGYTQCIPISMLIRFVFPALQDYCSGISPVVWTITGTFGWIQYWVPYTYFSEEGHGSGLSTAVTHHIRYKIAALVQAILPKIYFLEWKLFYCDSNLTDICFPVISYLYFI